MHMNSNVRRLVNSSEKCRKLTVAIGFAAAFAVTTPGFPQMLPMAEAAPHKTHVTMADKQKTREELKKKYMADCGIKFLYRQIRTGERECLTPEQKLSRNKALDNLVKEFDVKGLDLWGKIAYIEQDYDSQVRLSNEFIAKNREAQRHHRRYGIEGAMHEINAKISKRDQDQRSYDASVNEFRIQDQRRDDKGIGSMLAWGFVGLLVLGFLKYWQLCNSSDGMRGTPHKPPFWKPWKF